ncbi:uncharacterized protein YgbK (DUF1537 family) [Kribbella amoyensis]|uniref:Uncharacterized protein YgbK (DUF1537 family) n=1 Tax=Kribbella amoyensis TaxID=996641 RepID=A0A561BT78_9ACTN|nr:four-carbon acid sugar kinase family protein [Kribbella amoyensis]TWD82041.1 uncharacterized protein YgbK (DUF1537 family) [Kribbella amoyensis]
MTGLRVHADDLSGAAEVAALLGATALRLSGPGPRGDGLTVLDLDTRVLPEAAAEARAREALTVDGEVFLTKIDSLLRGNVAAHVRALDPARHPVVFAPALPAAGRTVADGVALVNGRPLSALPAWASGPAPASIADALGNLPVRLAGPTTVTRDVVEPGAVTVYDTATDEDLDHLIEATWDIPGIRYVGAGGLAAALARHRTTTQPESTRPGGASRSAGAEPAHQSADEAPRPVLFVVGTTEPTALDQLDQLASSVDTTHVTIPTDDLAPTPYVDAVAASLRARRGTTLRVTGSGVAGDTVAATLAAVTAEVVASGIEQPDLVLTGGHTARVVLDALGISRLTVLGEVHHGAVLLAAPDGRRIVTRPGSFGDRTSFAAIHAALRSPLSRKVPAS